MRKLWGLVVVLVAACGADEPLTVHSKVECAPDVAFDVCELECSVNGGRTVEPIRYCVGEHPEWGQISGEECTIGSDGLALGCCGMAPDGVLSFYECIPDTVCDLAAGECSAPM